jgi:hypothetical protein
MQNQICKQFNKLQKMFRSFSRTTNINQCYLIEMNLLIFHPTEGVADEIRLAKLGIVIFTL